MMQDRTTNRLESFLQFIQDKNLDSFYLSSYDQFLSEYVPASNSLRVYLTGFTGSVAEVLVKSSGECHLFVDGRYTQQAEKQVDTNKFKIHTCQPGTSPMSDLLNMVKDEKQKLGYIASRTSFSDFKQLREIADLVAFESPEIEKLLELDYKPVLNPIELVQVENGGVDTLTKLQSMPLKQNEAYLVNALDSLAWLSNGRGYHLPFMSSFMGTGLATQNKLYVFIDKTIARERAWESVDTIEWITFQDATDRKEQILKVIENEKVIDLKFDPNCLNADDFVFLNQKCQLENIEAIPMLITQYQSIKYPEEIHVMKQDFLKASKTIFETVGYVKKNWKDLTEKAVYDQTSRFYRENGGHSQSFNTIAGFAGNGSIIHYGSPSDQIKLEAGELFLLDSGGYFESGFATDKTRTFLIGDKVSDPEYKKIYTLVLKGLLDLQYAEFDEGALGKELDAIARKPLKEHGYDYNHGTGHGVGVNVHEGGVRIHLSSELPMKAGQVVSLEPGIYLDGKAGVRLENIAQVVAADTPGKLKFDNFVFIGFDHELIDQGLLDETEKSWLEEYERQCQTHGMSFKYPQTEE